jgi:hypothetical protein
MDFTDDVEPQGSVIERPRNAVGDAGCTRAWQFVVVSFFEAGQARVFSRSLS